jgi:hypothetical protein
VPFAAYIAGAEAIRAKQCNATDLYPGIGQVYEAAPAEQETGEELNTPVPLELPAAPNGEKAEPLPLPLVNPAAAVVPVAYAPAVAEGLSTSPTYVELYTPAAPPKPAEIDSAAQSSPPYNGEN